MRAIDADAFERSLAKYESDRRIRVESIENMIDEHTDGGRANSIRANAELDDENINRIVELAKEKVAEAHESGVRRGVEAVFKHCDPENVSIDDDDRPRYIEDGGERVNSESSPGMARPFVDRDELDSKLDEISWPKETFRRNDLMKVIDLAMTDDESAGPRLDSEQMANDLNYQLKNVTRQRVDDLIAEYSDAPRVNARSVGMWQRGVGPGGEMSDQQRGVGRANGWLPSIADDDADPALASNSEGIDRAAAVNERALNHAQGDHSVPGPMRD
jgi:hypothetical protein